MRSIRNNKWCFVCYPKVKNHEHYITICKNKSVDLPIEKEDNKYVNAHTQLLHKCKIKEHTPYLQEPHGHLNMMNGCRKCDLCFSCGLWMTYGKRLCSYCILPKENKLYYKTKEMDVVRFLKNNLPDRDFIHNKSVGSECTGGHLFPDIRFNCLLYNLIIEVYEYKHRGADYKCDESRMYDIIAKLGTPCIFIRYNPDNKFSDKNVLLEKIKCYHDLEENYPWNDISGLYVEYLFY